MIALLAHGGMLCPEEALAVVAGAGSIWWIKLHWWSLLRKVGFWLIARHLAKCHGECNFQARRYSVLAPR